ncbi:MAG: glycoside hydrolase family 3 C-terminal domain-containing protein [Firmicutes bacterium]|nr:glycoside hydrolase family 3 C-terminal domain-containing protein [Bacillota bacterium]
MELNAYERNHLKKLRAYLPECTVLLKNGGDFPLKEAGRLALYGGGARHTIKGGTGSGEVNSRFFITVERGLEKLGFSITTKEWLDAYDEVLAQAKIQFVEDIKARAKKKHTNAIMEGMGVPMPEPEYYLPLEGEGDVAVYVLSRISGEGNDRQAVEGDLLLTETEIRDIQKLNKKYDKFMLVLNTGGPVDLAPVAEVKNILVLSQLGVETGLALGNILLGKAYPSGKLTTTWAKAEDYCKAGSFGDESDTRYNEGIYVGYRYFDSVGQEPVFPFGYGLGYTTFSIGEAKAALEGETVSITVPVANTGDFAGKETVQVYVTKPQGKLDQPYQVLAGFRKSPELLPGESVEVTVSFKMSDLASYLTEDASYILENGSYIVRVGSSSRDTKVGCVINVAETVVVRKVKNALGTPDFEDWKPENGWDLAVPVNTPVLEMALDAIETETILYDQEQPIDPEIEALSDEELAYMNIGAFNPKGGALSVIGSASMAVPGAAGETTSMLKDKGIPAMIMADGPAGIRIQKKYQTDGKKIYNSAGMLPESMEIFLPKIARLGMKLMSPKAPKNAQTVEHYCTAIPIGTAIAQSWNPEIAEVCGDVVGEEMQLFGVHLWLAPALNIHRSILCGRNFEYYSEDPLISGVFAAGITKGVQKHPGCGTTIKHYAANNQELERYTNNSIVSERAMREIYLRGFEICVKTSQPHALMTSYNLLNGIHTNERRDLTEDILRSEFGFEGIVMTDWVISMMSMGKKTKYRYPISSKVAAAGGDLFMPGGPKDYKQMVEDLKKGELSRKQLEINATRVYRMAKKLTSRQDA